MYQSDTLGWIRVVLLLAVLIFVIGYSSINAGTDTTEKPTTKPQETTDATPETQETEMPACTIPTQAETTPQTEPPTDATVPSETEPHTETTPATNEPTRATEPPEAQPDTTGTWKSLGTYQLTAYCPCKQCCGKDPGSPGYGITATGATAVAGTTIAVDPSAIPYGSTIKINDHIYIAQDCGGAINGNRIDIYFDDHQDALQFGVQTAEVFLQTESS